MTIKYENWQITSDGKTDNYTVKKKVGTRWIPHSFHSTLQLAVLSLFDSRVSLETSKHIIHAFDEARSSLESSMLMKAIEDIRDDLLRGINRDF